MRVPRPSQLFVCALLLMACGGGSTPAPAAEGTSVFGPAWDDGKAEVAAYATTETIYGRPRQAEQFLITVTEDQDRNELVKALPGSAAKRRVVKLNRERTIPTGIYTYRQFSSTFVDRDTLELTKIAMSSQEWCGTTFVEATVRDGRMSVRSFSYFEGQGDRDFELAWPEDAWAVDALPLLARNLPAGTAGRKEVKLLPSLLSNKVKEPQLVDALVTWTAPEDGRREVRVGDQVLVLEAGGERRLLSWTEAGGDRAEFLRSERLPYWSLNGPGEERRREALAAPR